MIWQKKNLNLNNTTMKIMENKQYTRDEVHMLMCLAFEQGFKNADVVDARLENKETDVECAWILTKYDSSPDKTEYYEHNT